MISGSIHVCCGADWWNASVFLVLIFSAKVAIAEKEKLELCCIWVSAGSVEYAVVSDQEVTY